MYLVARDGVVQIVTDLESFEIIIIVIVKVIKSKKLKNNIFPFANYLYAHDGVVLIVTDLKTF